MTTGRRSVFAWVLWAGFALFVVYGTTIPFDFGLTRDSLFAKVAQISWIPLHDPVEGGLASIPDMVQNVLLFLPFGFLGFWALGGHRGARWLVVTILGGCLSLFVELLQLLTVGRTTSTTDLVTNSSGAFFGFWMAFVALAVFRYVIAVPALRRYVTASYFFVFIVAFVTTCIGAWEPFDFTLDVSAVASSVRDFFRTLFDFTVVPRDEPVTALRLALFALACSAWLREVGRPAPALLGAGAAFVLGVGLELSQAIVSSRSPSSQDMLVIALGCALGAGLLHVAGALRSPWAWAAAIVAATCVADASQMLHPFRAASEWNGINWVPFLPYYERTSFVALSNFIEGALIFFPMGFVLRYLFPRAVLATVAAGLIAFGWAGVVEIGQGFVDGRHPDVTDVLGALAGALAGAWTCSRGWPWFRQLIDRATAGGEGATPPQPPQQQQPPAPLPPPSGGTPAAGAPPWG